MNRLFCLSIAAVGLSGCGGAQLDGPMTRTGQGFGQVQSDFLGQAAFADSNAALDPLTFAQVQAQGGASYSGQAAIFLSEDIADIDAAGDPGSLPDPSLLGQVALQTSFGADAGTITGTMTNFVDSNDQVKTGSLVLSDGAVASYSSAAVFLANINGTLSGPGLGNGDYPATVIGLFDPDGSVLGFGGADADQTTREFAIVFAAQ